jgi:hypothetical protein
MPTLTVTTPAKLAALREALRGRVINGIIIHDTRAEIVPGATGNPSSGSPSFWTTRSPVGTPGHWTH